MNNSYQNRSNHGFFALITLVLMLFTLAPSNVQAQVLQVESFESTIFPAPGWRQIKAVTAATGAFIPQTGPLTNPATVAPLGTDVMIYNSATASVNDTSFMISKPFDFSACGATDPTFSFQMYHDNGFIGNRDSILVYINTVPSFTGATYLNSFGRYGAINGWVAHNFTLPAASYNGGAKRNYIILVGIAKGGNNMYIDNFRVNTFPSPTVTGDVSMDVVQQNFASVGTGTTNQWIIGVRCIVGGTSGCGNISLGTAVKLDSLLFNTNGTTNVNDIQNARVWYTGGSQQFSTAYLSPFPAGGYPSANYGGTIAVPATDLNFVNSAVCFHLEYDTTYFWLTYDVKATATGGNTIDGDFRGANVSPGGGPCPTPIGSPTSTPVTVNIFEIAGGPKIDLPYCVPTYTTGTKWANYNNNDYIHAVEFFTAVAPTFINTGINSLNVQDPASWCYGSCHFAGHPPDYELWPARPGTTINLTQGASYNFRAQCGTWFSSNWIQAWIDYNHDGDFLDPGEALAATLTNLSSLQWQTFNFTVPPLGYAGPTRLRVREVFANSNINPCQQYTFGECEDYYINILPNCPAGYKLWLGNNSDWNDPANWCGGIPTSSDDAVVNRTIVPGLGSRNYYPPVVKSGMKANTRDLSISAGDTLYVNAPSPADTALRVHGNLTNNGRMEVIGGFSSNFTLSNGTLENNIYTPFRGSVTDARCQIWYSAAELAASGLVANDRITRIGFTVMPLTASGNPGKNSTAAFSNFTVSYGFQPGASTGFASNVPVPTGTTVFGPAAYTTVAGANQIVLAAPIIWDGTSSLVIQYCFDNFASSGNDLIKITQTTGRKTTLLLTVTSANAYSGCSLVPGAGVSDNFFGSAGINRPNFTFYLDRLYGKPLVGVRRDWINNGLFVQGNSRVIMDSTAAQNITGVSTTTFHELEVRKTALSNTVTMQRAVNIEDTLHLTQGQLVMNKYSLNILNSSGTSNPGGNSISTLSGPISRTSGILLSEDSLSKVNWTIGTVSSQFRVIPFGNAATAFIPFSFLHTSGDLGTFSVATYSTTPTNIPWPPTVSHINGISTVGNSAAAVDRFWITNKGSSATATLDLAFRWTAAERASVAPIFAVPNNYPRAYPWRISPDNMGAWLKLYTSPVNTAQLAVPVPFNQIHNATYDSVVVKAFNYPAIVAGLPPWLADPGPMPNYLPWAVAGSSNTGALPVELLNFTANQAGNKVKVEWNTASEINNDYFIVERSGPDQNDFVALGKVRSWFNNSSVPLYYELWDDRPLDGLQYYRLKQVDLDGQFTYSNTIPVTFDPKKIAPMPFVLLSTYTDQLSSGIINLEFSYNSEEPLDYMITDATGRIVATGSGIEALPGVNKITLNHTLIRGMYIVTLRNSTEAVSRRFVY